jgi:hypothetical protein
MITEINPTMNSGNQWHVLYTKPNFEKKVAQNLTRKGIENFCPFVSLPKTGSMRFQYVELPLFASYVFVYMAGEDLAGVKKINGVINPLYWKGIPAVVADEDIVALRRFLNQHPEVYSKKVSVYSEAPRMQVTGDSIMLSLPSIGYMLQAPQVLSPVLVPDAVSNPKPALDHALPGFSFAWK